MEDLYIWSVEVEETITLLRSKSFRKVIFVGTPDFAYLESKNFLLKDEVGFPVRKVVAYKTVSELQEYDIIVKQIGTATACFENGTILCRE